MKTTGTVDSPRVNGAQKQRGQQPPRQMVPLPFHDRARTILDLGKPPLLLLVGDPGVGKTTFGHAVARERTGAAPIVISGTPEMELHHLWGRWNLIGEETVFTDGPLPKAITSSLHLLIEEFSQIPIECRSSLLPLRDQKEITNPLTCEVLEVPESFRVIATSNSESLSCRANRGIAKVLFDGMFVLECDELTERQVDGLLKARFPNAQQKQRAKTLALWNEYRDFTGKSGSGKSHLSYRAAEQLLALLLAGMAETEAVQVALINKFLPSDEDLFNAAKLKNSIAED